MRSAVISRAFAPGTTLASALEARLAEARAAWPGVALSNGAFTEHLVEKLASDTDEDFAGAFGRVRLPELFLACACAQRDPAAIAHFEARYFAEVDAAARRFPSLPVSLGDVQQRMRELLFLPTPRARPALAGYAGLGDLRGWLRAAALHMLLNISTREARERPTESQFFELVMDGAVDTEAAYLKWACRAEFQTAFASAMEKLTARERQLLRSAFADGLNVDQIGAMFRVHRATAARWLAKARMRLVQKTQRELMASLRVTEGEAASIVRAALSRIGPTILRGL